MKLGLIFLAEAKAFNVFGDWMSSWANQVFSINTNTWPNSLTTGEHPSVLCLDDSDVTLEQCLEVSGTLYAATCNLYCSNDRDVCVGSHKTSTATMRSCTRSICSPNLPVLFNGKCTPACLQANSLQFSVDKEGPYCATNGEKYSSKYDLYRDACAKEEIIEIDENCVAYYQKMIEFHQNELEKWTELLTSVTPAEAQERFSVFRVILKTQIIWAR